MSDNSNSNNIKHFPSPQTSAPHPPLPPEFAGALEVNKEPFRVAGWLPIVDIFCECYPDHIQLVHLFGINVPSMCPLCRRIYVATGFNSEMGILISVRKGVPAP